MYYHISILSSFLLILLQKHTIFPNTLLYHSTRLIHQGSFPMLPSMHPLPFVMFSWGEHEHAHSVFPTVLVLSPVRRSIRPGEVSTPMHLPLLPGSVVSRGIREHSYALSLRSEGFFVDFTTILTAVSILDFGLALREVLNINFVRFRTVMRIVKHYCTSLRVRVWHNTIKSIATIAASNFSLALCFSIFQLTLVLYFLPEQLDSADSTRHLMKLSMVQKVIRNK